jgi:hypothetical protein
VVFVVNSSTDSAAGLGTKFIQGCEKSKPKMKLDLKESYNSCTAFCCVGGVCGGLSQ